MERKNILFISSWYPNKVSPTDGNFVQRHAEAVSKFHDVEILHAIGDFNQKETYVLEEKFVNGLRTVVVYYKNSNNPAQNFYRRMKAYKMGFQKMKKPDLLHANILHNSMLFAKYIKRKYKIPYVVTEHWTALQENATDALGFKARRVAKLIAKDASKLLPVCGKLEKGLESLGANVPIEIIPNVVDTQVFSVTKRQNVVPKFLHISNLSYMKNVPAILDAFYKIHQQGYNFELEIGGNGDLTPIVDFVERNRLHDKISVFSSLNHIEVAQKMQQSDVFVLFSKYENQPCVISEAMSVGLFVVSSDVGGIKEFFPDRFGILVEKDNQLQLQKAIIDFIEGNCNVATENEMHDYAVQTFSVDTIGKKFSDVYKEILQS